MCTLVLVGEQDDTIERILSMFNTITVVGASRHSDKAAYNVPFLMQREGWKIIPVNPYADRLYGEPAYRRIFDIPGGVTFVNVFRPAAEAPEVAQQAIDAGASALWLQLGITSPRARSMAREAGLLYVEDRCLIVEQRRLGVSAPTVS